ncbi:unknown [Fusobacterium sp. CAG:649]|nr:unknown [Fusobacterium sp. CAG:649]
MGKNEILVINIDIFKYVHYNVHIRKELIL